MRRCWGGAAGGDVLVAARSAAGASGRIGDPATIRSLPALTGTQREIDQVSALFPPQDRILLTGNDATETQLAVTALASASVLHFATHGLVTGDLPSLTKPALVLTPPDIATTADDGFLTASDASQLTLNADWVILSACNTAAGDASGGQSLSGLARAFFIAGARSLMVSHWPVRDDAAAWLVTDTIGAVRRDATLSRAKALQTAMISRIDCGGSLAHPIAWAPFVLVGDSGPFR